MIKPPIMDKSDLMKYYKRPCYIFNSEAIAIEDDEILDLDSISLDGNEDTWLWSNSKGNHYEDVKKKKINAIENATLDDSEDSSRISLTNWTYREQTVGESFFDIKTPYKQKSESTVSENILPENVSSLKKNEFGEEDLFSNERDTFKKPAAKRDLSDKNSILYSIENKLFSLPDADMIDHKNGQNYGIKDAEMQEKNYAELNGTEKRKSMINHSFPICHSTPMPMLSKRRSRIEHETRSNQKPREKDECDIESPILNSTFIKEKIELEKFELAEAVVELSIREKSADNLNSTYDLDDNISTSSNDSRRSSSSGHHLPRPISRNRTPSRPSSSNYKLNLSSGGILNSSRLSTACIGKSGSIRSPSRPNTCGGRKAPFTESKMKQPGRRAPSLNRLQTPSLNIDEEFISVVEIKSKDNGASKNGDKKSPPNGPVSHIPRPSTRIPIFRNSASCTRTSFKK